MLFPDHARKGHSWFARHSLSIVLVVLMVVQTWFAVWTGERVYAAEQPGVAFWIWWAWEYNVSLVADTFGVLLVVLLTKWLYEDGSKESN